MSLSAVFPGPAHLPLAPGLSSSISSALLDSNRWTQTCLSLCPCQTVLFCTLNVIFITAFVFIIKKCLFIQLPILLDYVSLDDRGHVSFGVCIPRLCELGARREEGPAAGQKAGEMNIGFAQRPHGNFCLHPAAKLPFKECLPFFFSKIYREELQPVAWEGKTVLS